MSVHPMISMLAPELVLIVAASLLLIVGHSRRAFVLDSLPALTLIALGVALWLAIGRPGGGIRSTHSLQIDALVYYARWITLCVGVLIVLVNRHVPAARERGEYFALMLFSLAGISLVAVADDMILLFLALELVSVPTYVLIGLSRTDVRAQEATGKYFFLGAFAAAFMLYGFSFLYGIGGTTTLFGSSAAERSLAQLLVDQPALRSDPLTMVGLMLVLAGIAFKLAAVPLHYYVADVYHGAASPVAGMLGFVPKFAGILALVRVASVIDWQWTPATFWLLWAMAVATMFVGNTLALMQTNAKRMLAYSSVAHSGYMLVALLAGPGLASTAIDAPTRNGVTAALFYMAIYGLMNLGAFAALAYIRSPESDEPVDDLEDLAGASQRHPAACLALAVCVLSLMGIPPMAGFLGKLYVFSAAIAAADSTPHPAAMIWLVVIGVGNSAIAAAYYLRIIATCYLRPALGPGVATRCDALRAGLAICAIGVVGFFAFPNVLSREAGRAGQVCAAARSERTIGQTAARRTTASESPAASALPRE